MARGGKSRAVRRANRIPNHEDEVSHRVKRVFYILLDIIILVSFSLALYYTCAQDYTRTILFLAIGTLLLMFFIVKRAFKRRMK
jgi:hypothetical protein